MTIFVLFRLNMSQAFDGQSYLKRSVDFRYNWTLFGINELQLDFAKLQMHRYVWHEKERFYQVSSKGVETFNGLKPTG